MTIVPLTLFEFSPIVEERLYENGGVRLSTLPNCCQFEAFAA